MAAAGVDPAPFDLSVEAGWRFAKDAIDEALLDHTGSEDEPPLKDTTSTMDEMELLSRARRLAVMRRILLDIARGPSESSTGPKRTERVSEITNRLSRYRVGMSILHAHASKRLRAVQPEPPKQDKTKVKRASKKPGKDEFWLKDHVGWSVDVSLADVIHAFMHEHIPTSGWSKKVTTDLEKARSIATGSQKLRKPARKRLAAEICAQASILQQCLGGMHHALAAMEEGHSNHALVNEITGFFQTHGVETEPCSRTALESLLGDFVRALQPTLLHISTHGVHKAANGLGLSEDSSVLLGWSSVITSTFEQALDTLLDKEDAWVVNRLPCHGLVFARGRNSATDIQKNFLRYARKALHNTITTAMGDDPAGIKDQKVRNQISQLVSNVLRIDVVKQSSLRAPQQGIDIQPLGPLDLEAMETMLTKIADATKAQLSSDREAWVALSQYANEHDEDNEAQGLHDVYFDVIGLSKVVWGNTGTKHLVTKGGSKGQRVLSGLQGEVHEQFRIGGLAGASIDMSLITFLLVFQRSGDVQSEEEGPQSIGGDEANLVVRASESGLAILADKAEAMLSTLLDCDHAPLNRRLGWKVREGRGRDNSVSIECELDREQDKPRPALGAPMWWMRNTPYHASSKDLEADALTDQFLSVKEAKDRNRLSLEQAPRGGIFLRMDNDAPPLM